MATVTLQELQTEGKLKKLPHFKAGQTVRVHQKIKEGDKERVQIFQGLIIETSGGRGVSGSITVRRIVDGIGVEKVFPIHSPFIEKIELVKEAKVRRSRIFFMRERSGKSARLQERFFSESELKEMMPHEVTEEEVEEAVEHKREEEESASDETSADKDDKAAEEVGENKVTEEEAEEAKEESAEKQEEEKAESTKEDVQEEKATKKEGEAEEKTEEK